MDINLEQIDIFKRLGLLIHEERMSLHLYRALNSFSIL